MRTLTIAAVLAMSTQMSFAESFNRHVMIINDTDFTMTQFYASNKDSTSWEEDILGSDVLPAHSQIDINIDDGTGYCIYDFKAVFEDGVEVEGRAQNVCEIPSWTVN